jgi:ABC-type multidrug transport system ATPase subunit
MRIEADRVTRSYGAFKALDSVSFEIEPGQIVALLGPNGAGKSTLLRCLAAVTPPDKGRVLMDGEPLDRGRVDLRRRLMFIPDTPAMFPGMTVVRHIGMALHLYGEAEDQPAVAERVIDILRDLDILALAEANVGGLSRGEGYKAGLAALFAVDPELWILDEPFASGMDPNGLITLKRRIRERVAGGGTVIYTTQLLDIAEEFSDRVVVLHRGEVRAFDSVTNLRGVLEELFRQLREERK